MNPNPSDPKKDAAAPAAGGAHSAKGETPGSVVFTSMSGMGADEHDTHPPGATVQSVEAGHEPDRFNVKPILYVPALVAVTVVVAFGIITLLFNTIVGDPEPDANTNPQLAATFTRPIDERFARISSSDPQAPVNQPRLEYMKQTSNSPEDPPYYRSKLPVPAEGATYEIYPQDLRPANFIDPTMHRKILIETRLVNQEKGVAAIPIADAMAMLLAKNMLPVRKTDAKEDMNTVTHPTISLDRAKLSNAGRGGPSMPGAVKLEEKLVGDKKPKDH